MQKIKPYRSKKHLAWIRTKPCCHCGTNLDIVAHHLISCGLGGSMGSKQPDSLTIPLCVRCHAIVHASGGTTTINQLWYLYQLIRLAVRNRELIAGDTLMGFCVASDDTNYLTDFANCVRNEFASGKMALK